MVFTERKMDVTNTTPAAGSDTTKTKKKAPPILQREVKVRLHFPPILQREVKVRLHVQLVGECFFAGIINKKWLLLISTNLKNSPHLLQLLSNFSSPPVQRFWDQGGYS